MDCNEILHRQIDAVGKKNLLELKEKFQELFGFNCGETTTRNLRRRIAYRLQELYYGGIAQEDLAILNDLADKDPAANMKTAGATHMSNIAGTRYCRVWHGKEYQATVQENGKFEYEGKSYRSLSAIARKITGSHWNGKVFFGVK